MHTDDLTLLRRWRNGDRLAGEALARKHYRPIFTRLRRKLGGDSDLAADLTQQVFKVAVANRDDIVTDLRRYLYGTARFKLYEHRRGRAPADESSLLSGMPDPAHGACSIMVASSAAKLLVRALLSLSIEEQSYVMWYYADGLTQVDIAARVGLTAPQVNGRIHRAKDKLRNYLEALSRSAAQRESIDKGFDSWVSSLRRKLHEDHEDDGDARN
jgi:RNA polymerase sigma factor (sigma-70 family)